MGREEMMEQALSLYNEGQWDEALALYNEIKEIFSGTRDICAMEGWVWWKKRSPEKATELWNKAVDLTTSPDMPNSIAMSGLGLAMAEKGDSNAMLWMKTAIEMLPRGKGKIDTAIRFNTCAIALAKLGDIRRTEEILQEAIEINERFEDSSDSKTAKTATHQRAKNGYNLCSFVLIPQGKLVEAFAELLHNVVPRYEKVGAKSDLAAAYYRLGLIKEKQKEFNAAEEWYTRSKSLWGEILDPARIREAQENIDRVKELI